ncbi:MAG TPA: rhamnogalacturonan acetylesterase [Chitinophagaceae bacterium]|nr:rhamnogalacturonan acetylesterase [Chitinophagaceae bacterium]
MKKHIWLAAFIILSAFNFPPKNKIKIFLAGDSTISVKEVKAYPETGWGMPFVFFFDSTVTVDNRAKNGRSTRTFISEGLWKKLIDDVREGDYVFIQFGHNDESPEKTERYSTPEQYKINISRFISETRAKKATPVLLTPVSRRKFKDGKAIETHEVYSKLVRELSQQMKIPFIDLDKKSMELYQEFGEETSKLFFLQLQPGEHPNYPEGKVDNTHFNELGARKIAQIVLQEIRNLNLDLADRIVKPVKK